LRPDSDVDLAILPADPGLPLALELDLTARLSAALRREVDVLRLDHAPTLLRWEVVRKGRVIWARSPAEAVRFRAEVAAEYADFAPAYREAAERFRRHLAGSAPAPREGS
jgi:predicted nucleotidyltransferase